MYHPTAMMTVAHTREAELLKEAQGCGLPQDGDMPRARLSRRMLAVGLWLAALAALVGMWAG